MATVFVTHDATSGAINGVFARPQPQLGAVAIDDQDPAIVAFLTAPVIPQQVALWQAKAALDQAGLLAQADAAVAALGNGAVTHFWANAQTLDRSSPTLAQLAATLKLSGAQIDALFVQAAGIKL